MVVSSVVKLHFCCSPFSVLRLSLSLLLFFVFCSLLCSNLRVHLFPRRRLGPRRLCRRLVHDFLRAQRLHDSIFQKVRRRRRPRQVRKVVQQRVAHVFLVLAVLSRRVFFPPFLQVFVVLFQFLSSQLVVDDDSFRVRLVALRDFHDVLLGVDGFQNVVGALDVATRRWVFSRHVVTKSIKDVVVKVVVVVVVVVVCVLRATRVSL